MISQATKDLLGNPFAVREIARLTVVGRREPVTVYEPLTDEDYETKKDVFALFDQGLRLYYEGEMAQGLEVFNEIRALDSAAAAYAEKCQALLNTELKDWRGVWVMKTK